MAFIIRKVASQKVTIVIIPKRPMDDMLDRHVTRNQLSKDRDNTCMVNSRNNWMGRPRHNKIIRLLIEALKKGIIYEGKDIRYDIPHHFFGHNVRCRDFDGYNNPKRDSSRNIEPPFDGQFAITFIKMTGGKTALKEVAKYDGFNHQEHKRLLDLIKKTQNNLMNNNPMINLQKSLQIFIVKHLHPARKK